MFEEKGAEKWRGEERGERDFVQTDKHKERKENFLFERRLCVGRLTGTQFLNTYTCTRIPKYTIAEAHVHT